MGLKWDLSVVLKGNLETLEQGEDAQLGGAE